jgi:hypothetical protein
MEQRVVLNAGGKKRKKKKKREKMCAPTKKQYPDTSQQNIANIVNPSVGSVLETFSVGRKKSFNLLSPPFNANICGG